jgi:hypothetical protein
MNYKDNKNTDYQSLALGIGLSDSRLLSISFLIKQIGVEV